MKLSQTLILIILVCLLAGAWYVTFQAYVGKAEQVKIDQANEKAYTDSLQISRDKQGREVAEKYALQKTVAELKDNRNDLRLLLKDRDLKLKNVLATSTIVTKIDTFLKVVRNPKDSTYTFKFNPEFIVKVGVQRDSAWCNPYLTNKQDLVFGSRRETIRPPKKFFLFRWFQARHTVVKVIVRNSNEAISTNKIDATFIIKK